MLTNITSNTHPKTASLLEHAAPQATQYLAELDSRAVAPSADAVAQLASFKHPLQGGPVNPKQVIRELDEIGSSTAHRAHNHLYAGRKHQYRNHGPDRQYLRGRTARRHVGTCGQCVMPVDGGVANLIERTCGYARRFASAMQSAGYDVLNDVVLNQVLVSFGAPEVTLQVVRDIQADGTCWCGSTVWQGKTAMRISVVSWATTEEDVHRSIDAILCIAARHRTASQGPSGDKSSH